MFAASMKDRSAIFLGGLRPDAAFWYNASIGGWRSFSYYLGELPAWVEDFNARRDLDAYLETVWRPLFGKDQKRFRYYPRWSAASSGVVATSVPAVVA